MGVEGNVKSWIQASFNAQGYTLRERTILDSGSTVHIFNKHKSKLFRKINRAPLGDYIYTTDITVEVNRYSNLIL